MYYKIPQILDGRMVNNEEISPWNCPRWLLILRQLLLFLALYVYASNDAILLKYVGYWFAYMPITEIWIKTNTSMFKVDF